MTENVPEIGGEEFYEFVKKDLVFIDFFAEWCMPCIMMSPIIDDLSKKFKGRIKFCKVNVGDNEEIARKFNVSSIPNFFVLKEGKVIEQFVGALGEEELEKRLGKFLK